MGEAPYLCIRKDDGQALSRKTRTMNKRIKNVWLLTILSSFLLIALQGYWLYNSISYSMGEMEKANVRKVERAVMDYLNQVGDSVKDRSHIGYVVSVYFSDYSKPVTTVCSPEGTDTIVNGVVMRKPAYRDMMERRDTFDLRETDSSNSDDCINTYITFQMTRFDAHHFHRFMKGKLKEAFLDARLKTSSKRLWQSTVSEPASLFHHEMAVEIPFNPIEYQSMQVRLHVSIQPLLQSMLWQIAGSILVTILLLLSFAYLIKVMLMQKKVDKMRSDFVHTMIHELKRPVQTLKMCVSMLRDDEMAQTVREESDNLTAYLNKLREVIRAEEHIPLNISEFDVRTMLSHLSDMYRKNNQKEVDISLCYQRGSDLMRGDGEQLRNVVSNLLENAVKYSGDIVHIDIACQDTPCGEVAISIADNGIGISPEEQQRVWTKFYRSSAYPGMMQPGIGLGLSFVDMIVRAHGGRKTMQSEVGKGTKITITIPQ